MHRRQFVAAAMAGSCLLNLADTAQAQTQRGRVGRAYDARSGQLLYQERHTETYAGAQLVSDDVRYLDAAGRRFAGKRVRFEAGSYLPEFLLENQRTGHFEGARRTAVGSIEVQFRVQASEQARIASLPAADGAIADAGFDRFIESEWDALLGGARPVRPFLVPSRFDYIDFRIRRTDDSASSVRFALEIDSALLRLVVPAIEVTYDRESRRLLGYEGPSNLRDAGGKNYRVRIDFPAQA